MKKRGKELKLMRYEVGKLVVEEGAIAITKHAKASGETRRVRVSTVIKLAYSGY